MALTIPQAIRKLLIKEPFYGLFLLSLNKYFDDSIPTACVRRKGINVELAINPTFWNTLSDATELSIIYGWIKTFPMQNIATFAKTSK